MRNHRRSDSDFRKGLRGKEKGSQPVPILRLHVILSCFRGFFESEIWCFTTETLISSIASSRVTTKGRDDRPFSSGPCLNCQQNAVFFSSLVALCHVTQLEYVSQIILARVGVLSRSHSLYEVASLSKRRKEAHGHILFAMAKGEYLLRDRRNVAILHQSVHLDCAVPDVMHRMFTHPRGVNGAEQMILLPLREFATLRR